jgi:hypothetical protein
MDKRILILGSLTTAVALFVIGVSAKLFLHHLAVKKGVGPQHIFHVSESARGLTEQLALAKSREALRLDGDDPANWHPVQDPQSYLASRGYKLASLFERLSLGDGHTNEFLALESKRPSCGIIVFENDHVGVRFVRVGVSGLNVICQCSAGR